MKPFFPREGVFALIQGSWFEAVRPGNPPEPHVKIRVRDRETYDAWRPPGELKREWKGGLGIVWVDLAEVAEVVDVRWHARYEGASVYLRGPIREGGKVMVGLTSDDEQTAARLGFEGHQRDGYEKDIHVDELTDVLEETTTRYRR